MRLIYLMLLLLFFVACQQTEVTPNLAPTQYQAALELAGHDTDQAIALADSYTAAAQQVGNAREVVRGHQLKGYIYGVNGNDLKAFSAYADAYGKALQSNEQQFLIYELTQMAISAFRLGAFQQAADFFQRAIEEAGTSPTQQDLNYLGKAYMYLGMIQQKDTEKANEALQTYDKALHFLNDNTLQAQVLIEKARVHMAQSKFATASQLLEQAIEASNSIKFQYLFTRAHLDLLQSKEAESTTAFLDILDDQESLQQAQRFKLYVALGDIHSNTSEDQALEYYQMALNQKGIQNKHLMDVIEKAIALMPPEPSITDLKQELINLKTEKIVALEAIRNTMSEKVITLKVYQVEQAAMHAEMMHAKKITNALLIVAIILILGIGFWLHFRIKKLAIEKVRKVETEAAVDIIRDLYRFFRTDN